MKIENNLYQERSDFVRVTFAMFSLKEKKAYFPHLPFSLQIPEEESTHIQNALTEPSFSVTVTR